MCIFKPKFSLLQMAHTWILYFYPISHCLFWREFNLLIFKVVSDTEELTILFFSVCLTALLCIFSYLAIFLYVVLSFFFYSNMLWFFSHFLSGIFCRCYLCGYHGTYIKHLISLTIHFKLITTSVAYKISTLL